MSKPLETLLGIGRSLASENNKSGSKSQMGKLAETPIGTKKEIIDAYDNGILQVDERMYTLDKIYRYIDNKLNDMQDTEGTLGYKISYIAETIQSLLADLEIDDIREVRRLLLFEMCKFDSERKDNWKDNILNDLYETTVDDIIKLLTYLPDGNIFGVLYDFWKYKDNERLNKDSWYLEFLHILSVPGILDFKPYIINDSVLVIRYNKFLVNFRNMYYQVCENISGVGDCGHSLYGFGSIDNLHDNDELYMLIMLSEVLQPITQYYNDNHWSLIHSEDFIKFFTTSINVTANDYRRVLTKRIIFDINDEQNYITEFSVVKADKVLANVRVCPTKIQIKTKNGLRSQVVLDNIRFDEFNDLNTIYRLMIMLALSTSGIGMNTITSFISRTKFADVQLPLLENKVYNFNDILKMDILSMMDKFTPKTITSTDNVSYIVHRVRKDSTE